MKSRFFLLALASLALASACSGGGSGGSNPVPPTNPPSSSSPGPSGSPTSSPSGSPSGSPSTTPSSAPSGFPSATPSSMPSDLPSATPSGMPSSTPSNTPSPRPTATPTAQPTATPRPTATPAPRPTETPSPSPTSTPLINACNAPVFSTSYTFTDVDSTFFTSIVPNAKEICLSAWDFSSNISNALESASHNGANVYVIAPYSEAPYNATTLRAFVANEIHIVDEYTGVQPSSITNSPLETFISSPMDIHSKFALIDGVAYMDGHNWFSGDVILQDGNPSDYDAIQNVLTQFHVPAPTSGSFTNDKQVSLLNEANWINGQSWGPGTEYDFISESFNPVAYSGQNNDKVYNAMCHVATTQATMHLVIYGFSSLSTVEKNALQNLVLLDPNVSIHTDTKGQEKISMKRGGSTAWYGSSNPSSTDLFDWGNVFNDSSVISALQSNFDSAFNGASSIPAPNPGATSVPCS